VADLRWSLPLVVLEEVEVGLEAEDAIALAARRLGHDVQPLELLDELVGGREGDPELAGDQVYVHHRSAVEQVEEA
jgi:hypothetical protein